MKLKARKVPFSSVVGQIVALFDESGAQVAQLAIHGVRPHLPYVKASEEIADLIVAAINAKENKP